MRIDPKELSQPQLHGYLLGVIAPRPIAQASTVDQEGKVNLAPYSFFNVFSSNPATLILSPQAAQKWPNETYLNKYSRNR